MENCEIKIFRSDMSDSAVSFSLTVGDGVSELPHRANRRHASNTGHATAATSLFPSSFGRGLRGRLRSGTSGTLTAFQKDVFVVLDGLSWGGNGKRQGHSEGETL